MSGPACLFSMAARGDLTPGPFPGREGEQEQTIPSECAYCGGRMAVVSEQYSVYECERCGEIVTVAADE